MSFHWKIDTIKFVVPTHFFSEVEFLAILPNREAIRGSLGYDDRAALIVADFFYTSDFFIHAHGEVPPFEYL